MVYVLAICSETQKIDYRSKVADCRSIRIWLTEVQVSIDQVLCIYFLKQWLVW